MLDYLIQGHGRNFAAVGSCEQILRLVVPRVIDCNVRRDKSLPALRTAAPGLVGEVFARSFIIQMCLKFIGSKAVMSVPFWKTANSVTHVVKYAFASK